LLLNIRTKGKGSISVQCRAGDLEPGTINIQYKKPLAMFTKYLSALSLTGQLLFGLTTLGNASVVTKPTDQQVIYPPSTVPIVDMHTHMNLHPHIYFLVTEGGVDEAGIFHKVFRIDDSRLVELFAREVLGFLVHMELLSPEWAERLLSWRHTGFNVHSLVRAKTKKEAERVGKYMIRSLLSLERLSLDEHTGQVCYQYGKNAKEVERMDDLEFIARVTSHIPDKGQVTVRYYGLYANARRGKVKKACRAAFPLPAAFRPLSACFNPI
jgi:hypothetical protein